MRTVERTHVVRVRVRAKVTNPNRNPIAGFGVYGGCAVLGLHGRR